MPMINEAVYCLMEGVGTPEAIDTVMKLGMNHPMGPLALADLIGLDTCLAILEVLHEGLGDPKYRPCPLLRKYVAAGWLGRKIEARVLCVLSVASRCRSPLAALARPANGLGAHTAHRRTARDPAVAREFAQREIAPHSAEWDRDAHFEPRSSGSSASSDSSAC